jgi:hypothetical protein
MGTIFSSYIRPEILASGIIEVKIVLSLYPKGKYLCISGNF